MQHWLHQIRCSRGGATTIFIFIFFNYASLVPESVETDRLGTHCNPPDGGIRAARRSATACEVRQIEPAFAAIQSKKNWRLAFAAMHAEIPPRVGRFG
jgi:hypothetical protein